MLMKSFTTHQCFDVHITHAHINCVAFNQEFENYKFVNNSELSIIVYVVGQDAQLNTGNQGHTIHALWHSTLKTSADQVQLMISPHPKHVSRKPARAQSGVHLPPRRPLIHQHTNHTSKLGDAMPQTHTMHPVASLVHYDPC